MRKLIIKLGLELCLLNLNPFSDELEFCVMYLVGSKVDGIETGIALINNGELYIMFDVNGETARGGRYRIDDKPPVILKPTLYNGGTRLIFKETREPVEYNNILNDLMNAKYMIFEVYTDDVNKKYLSKKSYLHNAKDAYQTLLSCKFPKGHAATHPVFN